MNNKRKINDTESAVDPDDDWKAYCATEDEKVARTRQWVSDDALMVAAGYALGLAMRPEPTFQDTGKLFMSIVKECIECRGLPMPEMLAMKEAPDDRTD